MHRRLQNFGITRPCCPKIRTNSNPWSDPYAPRPLQAGFPDLARQIETAEPRQPRLNARNGRGAHPTPSEIIDRVRARNKERMGRSTSGGSSTMEAQFYGEIPIRSAEDLKAHRAELAKNRSERPL